MQRFCVDVQSATVFIPSYGSMEVFSLLCVCLFICLYGYGFLSGGKKDRGVKFCLRVRLLSGRGVTEEETLLPR